MRTMVMMTTTTTTPRGWLLTSTGPSKACRRLTSLHRVRGLQKGRKVEIETGAKERPLLAVYVLTRPLPLLKVGPFFCRDLPKRPVQAIMPNP